LVRTYCKLRCYDAKHHSLMNLFEVSKEILNRLTRIFLRDESGRRPVYGATEKFQSDPFWRDNIYFFEYFHDKPGFR
jgi:hypothetical protein